MLELLMGGGSGTSNGLLAGTLTKGWYGEVSASNFITGDALASSIGLTAGTSQYSDAGWLKFSLDSKTLYVAKRPFRYGISWDSINAVGAATGTKTITIDSKTYKVRLLKGRNDGTIRVDNDYDGLYAVNSEWNRLMYHVSGTPFANSSNKLTSEGISVGDWAQYSEADLLTHYSYGSGSYCWCQETTRTTNKVLRGLNGVSYGGYAEPTNTTSIVGWRPCLELIG